MVQWIAPEKLRTRKAGHGALPRACLKVLALASALPWFTMGCDAKVNEFTATPRHICAGERVALRWSVVGSATLEATPVVAGFANGSVDDEGSATITPTATTTVGLHVTRFLGSPTTSRQEIVVKAPNDKPEWLTASIGDTGAAPGCRNGKVWATVHAQRFAADVKVATVSSHQGDDRTYDVEHAGKRATIVPGTPSTAFLGTPMAGDWQLTATLADGQACGSADIPVNLVIDVMTQCNAGGAP